MSASIRSLATQIRATRKSLDLTQAQLALASGVGIRFIVDLESGKPTVRLESVLKVIEALGGEMIVSFPGAQA